MAAIITRTGKGAAITQSENDSNLDSLCGINEPQTGTTYTVNAADQNSTIEFSNAAPVTATLTLISTIIAANDTSDFQVSLKNIGAGDVTVTPTADTFDDGSATKVLAQFEWITIQTDSTQSLWNIIASSDASKVDGLDASQFFRSDVDDTTTGNVTISKATPLITINAISGNGVIQHLDSTATLRFFQRLNTSTDNYEFTKFDTDGSTAVAQLSLANTGKVNIATGLLQLASVDVTANATELSYNDITTLGTVQANKTVTANASKNIIGVNDLTVEGVINTDTVAATTSITTVATNTDTVTATTTDGNLDLIRNGTGDITVDSIPIYGFTLLDVPVQISSNTTEGSFYTIDATSAASSDAKKLIVNVIIEASGIFAVGSHSFWAVPFGQPESASDPNLKAWAIVNPWDGAATDVQTRSSNEFTINCDSAQRIRVRCDELIGNTINKCIVYLVGYYS